MSHLPFSADPDTDARLAHKLGDLRRAAGITQAELSLRSGVALTTLQKLESGVNRLLGARTEVVLRLAAALDATVESLTSAD